MINFLKLKYLYLAISLFVIGVGLFSIVRWGYVYSVDFVGGTNMQYQTDKQISESQIHNILKEKKIDMVSLSAKNNILEIRTKAINERQESDFRNDLAKKTNTKVTLLRSETVGPVLGKEMVRKTIIASLIGAFGILLYMSFAFKGITFALAAIIALVHDVLVVLGTYSLLSHFFNAQVDTLFVTAVLTTMSFSVHDTIIIFDKIREYIRREGYGPIENYANKALTETLVRSINNSMTIVFMLLALILLGGSTIKFFIITLLIGTITGTYSSPFVATPIVVWLEKKFRKH
jgi:preprotein translocase subunit SecF